MIYTILSLWIIYFWLELQWIILSIFFIIGTALFRGSWHYLIMNAIISIGALIGIFMSDSLLSIISCYGKIGYYPFFLVLSLFYYNSSYLFIWFDLINKRAYFSSFILILNVSIFFRCEEFFLVCINLMILISFIRLISSIKHIILISSYLLFIYLYLLILIINYSFSYLFLFYYIYSNTIIIVLYNTIYARWIINYSYKYKYTNVRLIKKRLYNINLILGVQEVSLNIKVPFYSFDISQYILLPIYSFIRLLIYSFDVIHTLGFYSWGIKIDAIPGRINSASILRLLWKGEYRGKCFELRGQGHLSMLVQSIVL